MNNPDKEPWLKEYRVFGMPRTLTPYPDGPVFDSLDHAAKKYKKQGLIQFNYKMTYPKVRHHALCLAKALETLGLKKGDRVATLLPTSIQFVIADFAISRAGLVHVPASSLEPVATLAHKFEEATPKALICLDDNLAVVKELVKTIGPIQTIVTRLMDYSLDPPVHKKIPPVTNGHWFKLLIKTHDPDPSPHDFNVREDLELILFTGGTTGLPKGCMLTHRNIYANLIQNEWSTGAAHKLVKGCLTVLLGLPFFHSYGHMIMHTMVQMGYNQILIPDSRDTATMVAMIKTHYPLLQIGVPTQFMNMSKEELKGIGMLGISASAPLPESVQKKYEKQSGGAIMEGYGLSEMSPATHLNTSLLLRLFGGRFVHRVMVFGLGIPGVSPGINFFLRRISPHFIGFMGSKLVSFLLNHTGKKETTAKGVEKRGTSGIPLPDTRIKIIDTATGNPLSWEEVLSGKTGEMCINGPQRMLGYWPDKGSGMDEEGYVHTGDVVSVDKTGYFYIVDRTKDMINVSGYKVYSREIDDLLYGYPGVEHAATVGIKDPLREGSERVVVYIEPQKEYEGKLDKDEIKTFLGQQVAKYAVPKAIQFVDEMPLTGVHKLDKKEIRKMAETEFAGAPVNN
ncbi:MAG: acyl--CoA ligase [Desulfobacterium sp.]|nr:acyl--CoA ligase [Desulfobacterium sp.]